MARSKNRCDQSPHTGLPLTGWLAWRFRERMDMMKRMTTVLTLVVALVLAVAGVLPSQALDRDTRLDVMSAVVQISWVAMRGDSAYGVGVGSGTIVSPDGLILTNCHVADPILFGMSPDQVPDFDYLGVSLTLRSDRPPQASYLAEVVAADPVLDLAVIRITRDLDMSAVDAEDLDLPWVEVGDSDQVEVGDELNIFGYPGIGGETITFTKGVVAGFSLDAAIDGRAWIKTDATIAGGNSGGTGVDGEGFLVGVPTRAGAGGGADYVDCRPLADTNGDGRIDDRDTCIPVGGFINALRPANLAEPLIEAARLGLEYSGQGSTKDVEPRPTGQARFSNLFFSPGVDGFNQPTSVVTSLPSGASSLYLFFDYENMAPGMTLEMKVSIDGREYPDWGLPAGPWGGDEEGIWWIGWSDADFADGTYQLDLYVDGDKLAGKQIEIGGPEPDTPSFSNIVFSLEETASGDPLEPAVVFSTGIQQLIAFFDYENMTEGLEWGRDWSMDGEVALSSEEAWDDSSSGTTSLTLTSQRGLSAGAYRLHLYIDGELAALSNFWVVGSEGIAASFEPVVFAEGEDRYGEPVDAAQSFASGLPELHAFSAYSGMEDGLDFTIHWYVDEQRVIESPYEWDGGESGVWHDYLYTTSGVLPDAEYMVELLLEGQVVRSGTTVVGVGTVPKPDPTPKPDDGVQMQGVVVDLDTERPIAGALVLLLEPGITLSTFEWTEEELYASAEADRNGSFELPALLEWGECYTLIVGAEGYWTFGQDDICMTDDIPSEWDVKIYLERK